MTSDNTTTNATAKRTYYGTLVDKRTIRYQWGTETLDIHFTRNEWPEGAKKGDRVKFNKKSERYQLPLQHPDAQPKFATRSWAFNIVLAPIEVKPKQLIGAALVQTAQEQPVANEATNAAETEQKADPTLERPALDIVREQLGDKFFKVRINEQPLTGVVEALVASPAPRYIIYCPSNNERYPAHWWDVVDVHPVTRRVIDLEQGDKVTFYAGQRWVPGTESSQGYVAAHAYGIRFEDRTKMEEFKPKTHMDLVGQVRAGVLLWNEEAAQNGYGEVADKETTLRFFVPGQELIGLLDGKRNSSRINGALVLFVPGYSDVPDKDGQIVAKQVRPQVRLIAADLMLEGLEVRLELYAAFREPWQETHMISTWEQLAILLDDDCCRDPQKRQANTNLRKRAKVLFQVEWPKLVEENEEQKRIALRNQRRQGFIEFIGTAQGTKLWKLGDDDFVRDSELVIGKVEFLDEEYNLEAVVNRLLKDEEQAYMEALGLAA